jgi:murein L,D-transpeptidase YafK
MLSYILLMFSFLSNQATVMDSVTFKEAQLKYERVGIAFSEKELVVKNMFNEKNVEYPPKRIFFRAFKTEKIFEVWGFSSVLNCYVLIHTYPICESSGVVGPKRQEGDGQVPEGFYKICVFNPVSNYFLSLGINYPNTSDSILTKNASAPGSDIYIHGNCLSIGCIPLTDDFIKEIYIMAVEARSNGQADIEVHIFPFKYDNELYDKLLLNYKNPEIKNFWLNLKVGYNYFENKKLVPEISVDSQGNYLFR